LLKGNKMLEPEIYKTDTTGKTRTWRLEVQDNQFRTIAGILGGALVTSGWKTCTGKQGRSDNEQATFEAHAKYENKLTREYHLEITTISEGAHFFKPMLAKEYKTFPGYCFAQPKLDGIRCIANRDGLHSRQGKPIMGVPHIFDDLQEFFDDFPDAVLDGELYNHELRDDFGEISSIVRKKEPSREQVEKARGIIQYHVYDIPSDAHNFGYRMAWLNSQAIDGFGASILVVGTAEITSQDGLDGFYQDLLTAGYEGQMVRLDAPYDQKRSGSLLKRKEFQDAEFEVVAIEEGQGNWAGVAKRVTCKLADGREFGAGIRGTMERAKDLLHETHNVVTVRFFALSPDGVPRFPVVTKFHGSERTL
jgi:DNA ligase-1